MASVGGGGGNNQLAKDFEFVWRVMTLRRLGVGVGVGAGVDFVEDPCSQIRRKVIFKLRKQQVPKTEQLWPLVSLALLNES